MLRAVSFLGGCFVAAVVAGGQVNEVRDSPPPLVQQCDHVAGATNCATWTWDGIEGYTGKWEHGEVGHIAVGSFDGQTVRFLRQDASGKKLLATYTGRISGNEIVNGVITWKVLGHEFKASWTGKLIYPLGSPMSPSDSPATGSPDAAMIGSAQAASKSPPGVAVSRAEKGTEATNSASAISAIDTAALRRSATASGGALISQEDIQTAVRAQQADTAKAIAAARTAAATVPQQAAAAMRAQYPDSAARVAGARRINLSEGTMSEFIVTKGLPVYPTAARAALLSGIVIVRVTVGRDGIPRDLVAEGLEVFAQSALDAAKQYRFRPYVVAGQAMEVSTAISIPYLLDNLLRPDGRYYSPDNEAATSPGVAHTDLPSNVHTCGIAGIAGSGGCGLWSLSGNKEYSRPVRGGRIEHLYVKNFDGETLTISYTDYANKTQTCDGRVTDDGIAYAVPTPGTCSVASQKWIIDLMYPTVPPPPNFLLGKWTGQVRPVVERPCVSQSGIPVDACAAMRAAQISTQTRIKAMAPPPLMFTATELIAPAAPGAGETKHYPATYVVNTARSVTVTLPYEDGGHGFECRLLPTGELLCMGGPMELTGLVHTN